MLRKRALLVGISKFANAAALPGALADVAKLSEVLRSPDGGNFAAVQQQIGMDGDGDVDATLFKQSVEQFFQSACHGELLFLYVASHAVVDREGTLSIAPSEFNPALLRTTGVPISFLGSCLNDCKASYVTIVVDTCFADAGAWELFSHRPTPFAVTKENAPTFSVIATTRARDAAADGAFAAVFAETVAEMDPLGGEMAVAMSRIFDDAAARLRDTAVQFAKKWESGGGAIPFGREHQGPILSLDGIDELYASVNDAELLRGEADSVFDFVEVRRNRFGVEERVGIVLPGRGIAAEKIKALGARITEAVRTLQVQGAIVLADRADSSLELASPRTNVLTFSEFRRRVQPIAGYLEEHIEKYESSNLHRYGYYVSVRATPEHRQGTCVLDAHLDEWLANKDDVNHLVVLGDFGTGKTTTARRLLWRQATRYLERPHVERVPIFVNLRNYNGINQIEGLVQRTLNEFRLNSVLTVEDIFAMNDDGRVLWILDGFDEMAAKVTPIVARRNFAEIQRLLPAKSRMILTCRTHFFGGMEQVKDTFQFVGNDLYEQAKERPYRIMFVQAFSPEEIRQFVRARLRDPELSGGELTPDVILEKIGESQELTDLVTRPILAEMIVFTLPDLIRKKLPLNLATLYREYTNNLLDRDAWRDVFADSALRHAFPQQLAWHLYSNGRTELTFEEFPKYVKQYFADEVQSYHDVLELVVAAQTTPLFQRDDAGNYAFAHKSFLEFYTARHLEDELANDNSDALEQALLTPEILRFLSQLINGNIRASMVADTLEERTRFSMSYFLKKYFRVRFVPVLKQSDARDSVQQKDHHRYVHLAGPFILAGIAGTAAAVMSEGSALAFLTWFVASYLAVIATSLIHYAYLTWQRRVMNPIWRYNVAGIGYVRDRYLPNLSMAFNIDMQMAMCIRDMDEERRPNAEHGWKTLQGLSVQNQEPARARVARRRSLLGPPHFAAAILFMLVAIAAAFLNLTSPPDLPVSWWLLSIGAVYGIALAFRLVAPTGPNAVERWLRRLIPAFVVLAVLLYAFFGNGWADNVYAPILTGRETARIYWVRHAIPSEVVSRAIALASRLRVPGDEWRSYLTLPYYDRDVVYAYRLFGTAMSDVALPDADRAEARLLFDYFRRVYSRIPLNSLYGFQVPRTLRSTPWYYLAFAHTAAVLALTMFVHASALFLFRSVAQKRARGWWSVVAFFILAGILSGTVVCWTLSWYYWMLVTYLLLTALSAFVMAAYVIGHGFIGRIVSVRQKTSFWRRTPVNA